jgi:hypothetical protein
MRCTDTYAVVEVGIFVAVAVVAVLYLQWRMLRGL